MSNCNNYFTKFNNQITITDTKKNDLIRAKDNLKNIISNHFKDIDNYSYKGQYIQGSYKLKTLIRTKEDKCDLDLGLYFDELPSLKGESILNEVSTAVENVTTSDPIIKSKCVRLNYSSGFHIDMPVYEFNDEMTHPSLVVKNSYNKDKSDPKEFTDWFRENYDEDGQLKRIIRYLKAFGDNYKGKSPSGLAFTIWATKIFNSNDRDDVCFHNLITDLLNKVEISFKCYMPTTPNDNVNKKLTETQKENFKSKLRDFVSDSEEAIQCDNTEKSIKIWGKYFGVNFPEFDEEMENLNEMLSKAAILKGGKAETSSDGKIVGEDEGVVKNKKHRFYSE